MTLAELRQRVDTYENIGQPTKAARAAITYETRRALSFTALVLAIFILSIATRRGIGRVTTMLLIAGGYAGYQALVFGIVLPAWTVPEAGYQRLVFGPWTEANPFLLAWLPNITLMTMAALSFATQRRSVRTGQRA
jgi:lipopolysaccharide export LptBFGC system permease protein LptF